MGCAQLWPLQICAGVGQSLADQGKCCDNERAQQETNISDVACEPEQERYLWRESVMPQV